MWDIALIFQRMDIQLSENKHLLRWFLKFLASKSLAIFENVGFAYPHA